MAMTAKDAAFITLFILFMISVAGNAFLLPYFLESGQAESDLRQDIVSLETEKSNLRSQYEQEIEDLEDENEDLTEDVAELESTIQQLKSDLESKSGTAISYEELVNSLRIRIYDLEAESLQIQSELNECRTQKERYCGHYCYCDPCYYCPPYYACYNSVSVSNVSGTFHGSAYDAVIYVYFQHYPCHVLRIYVDILDLSTIQIVGVDWD